MDLGAESAVEDEPKAPLTTGILSSSSSASERLAGSWPIFRRRFSRLLMVKMFLLTGAPA